jgi:hypothetical protein
MIGLQTSNSTISSGRSEATKAIPPQEKLPVLFSNLVHSTT